MKFTGHEAFIQKLNLVQKAEKDGILTFDMMQDLHTFQFFATPSEQDELSRITNALLSHVKTGSKKKAKGDKEVEAEVKRAKLEHASVLALFG